MQAARRTLQIVRAAMLVSILIYAFMIRQFPSTERANAVIYYVLVLVAVWILISLFGFRRKFVKSSEGVLVTSPDDPVALRRWQTGYVLTYAFSESIALYGVLLHFLGFGVVQVVPFLLAAFLLIVFYSPRVPVESR